MYKRQLTDSEGNVTLPELEAGQSYFVTAEKLITTAEGTEVTEDVYKRQLQQSEGTAEACRIGIG